MVFNRSHLLIIPVTCGFRWSSTNYCIIQHAAKYITHQLK